MSGRIKLLQNGKAINSADSPELGYSYDDLSTFDQTCGTYDLDRFQVPNDSCPHTFVCETSNSSRMLSQYSDCINAMNCAMLNGMTVGVSASSPVSLFIHQMIPHHQNAVNMAKATLKYGSGSCGDLTNAADQDCVLEIILRSIINNQNDQIQQMRKVLYGIGNPVMNDCVVNIDSSFVDNAQK